MRWFRILAIVAVLFVGAIVAAIITLNSLDWSDYQEPIVEAVESATGRKLTIDGELRLRIGFVPSVSVDGVTFSNVEWGSRPEMVKLERFAVRLRLLPLLMGRVEVGRVELTGLDVLLETNPEGEGNWVFAAPDAEASPGDAPSAPTGEEPVPDDPDADEPGGDPSTEAAALEALVEEALVENLLLVYRDGTTGESQEIRIDRLLAKQPGSDAPLALELRAQLNGEPIELDAVLEGALDVPNGAPLGLDVDLRAGGATVTAKGRIEKPLDATGIAIDLTAAGDTVASLSALATSALPDLGPYRVAASVSDDAGAYIVRDLDVTVGSSTLKGVVRADATGDRPRVEAQLESPRLDLADFQDDSPPAEAEGEPEPAAAPAGGGGGKKKGGGSNRVFPKDPLPLEGLRSADAVVALDVAELLANEIAVSDLELRVRLENGVLKVQPLALGVSGGRVDLGLELDGSKQQAALATKLSIRKVDVGALLTMLEATDVLSGGDLDLDLDLRGAGESVRGIMASLDGSVRMEMGQGNIQNDWAQLVLSDIGSLLSKDAAGDRASLNCIVGQFDVRDGIADASELVVDTKTMAVFGQGDIDLRKEKLDLLFDPVVKAGASVPAPPARVGGTLAAPEYGVDKKALTNAAVGLLADLAFGGSGGGRSLGNTPGVKGCEQLIAMRSEEAAEEPASVSDVANKKLKKQKKKLKKKQKKLLGDAVKGLDGLFGR